ncbi:MAG: hypothetical protein HYV97_04415 [Bdellovibrio sp.]|nr:hypothetical protein [Bdellovibrio sp.]
MILYAKLALASLLIVQVVWANVDDQPSGWYFTSDGSEEGYPVFVTNDYGETLSNQNVPATISNDQKYQTAVKALRAAPKLDTKLPTTDGGIITVKDVLAMPVINTEIRSDGKLHYLGTSELCPDSRLPMGKLLFCLRSASDQLEVEIGNAQEYAKKVGAQTEEVQNTITQMQYMRSVVRVCMNTLAQAHELPTKNMSANFHKIAPGPDGKKKTGLGLSPYLPRPRVSNSPLRKGNGTFSSDYLDCFWRPEDRAPILLADQIECRLMGTHLEIFAPELEKIYKGISAHAFTQSYFEALRMEAIARAIKADHELTGFTADPYDMPNRCEPFKKGFDRFAAATKPRPNIPSADELLKVAEEINNVAQVARKLQKFLNKCVIPGYLDEEGNVCLLERIEETKKELMILEKVILDRLVQYPYLRAGHSAKKEVYENLPYVDKLVKAKPADLARIRDAAIYQVHLDFRTTLQKFCKSSHADSDWDNLVNMPEITSAVLAKFPEFTKVQECAEFRYKKEQFNKSLGNFLLGFGCAIGSVVPGVGPACAAYYLGTAVSDYMDASTDLRWKQACLSTAAAEEDKTICSSQDYLSARENYDDAVTELVIRGIFAGMEGAGQIARGISSIRAAARETRDIAELERVAARLRSARSLEEAKALTSAEGRIFDGTVGAPRNNVGALEFERIPEADFVAYQQTPPVRLSRQPTEESLLGRASTGAAGPGERAGGVYRAVTSDGQEVAVKIYGDFTALERLGGVENAEKYMIAEMAKAKELERMGLGPKVYGTTRLEDGRLGLVTDVVPGKFQSEAGAFINQNTYKDIEQAIQTLNKNGYGAGLDFQFMIKPNGHIAVVDSVMLTPLSQCANSCRTTEEIIEGVKQTWAKWAIENKPK